MKKPTKEDIERIEKLVDQIATCTTKLKEILKKIDSPNALEGLKTWIVRIDQAIANDGGQSAYSIYNVDDTLSALKHEVQS